MQINTFQKKLKYKKLSTLIALLLLLSIVYAQSITLYNGASSTEIDPKKQSQVILKQGETITINNIDYPAKQDSKFTFNEKGELTTGTSFTTEQGTYNIKGFEIDLPEDSTVTYQEDKITIRLKKSSKLSVKETNEAQSDIPIEFISDEELEVDGIKINSLPNQETKVYFDTEKKLFYIKKVEINGFQFGKLTGKDNTYLFSSEIPKDFKESAIMIKDNKIILRAPIDSSSTDITYTKDKAKSILQARAKGEIEIIIQDKRLDITTKGDYKIFNGKILEENGEIAPLSESLYKIIEPTEKTIPFHVTSIKEDGTPMKGETFYDKNGNFFVGYNQGDGIYTKSDGTIHVETDELKTSFENLNQEQNEKFQTLSKSEKLEVLRGVAGGGSLGRVLDSISTMGNPKSIRELPVIRNVNRGNKILNEIAAYTPEGFLYNGDAHYSTHYLQSGLRNVYGNGGRDAAMYLSNGEFVVMENPPGITLNQLADYIYDKELQGTGGSTYLIGSQKGMGKYEGWNSQPLSHMWDEWGAYVYTAKNQIERGYAGSDMGPERTMNLMAYNMGMLDLVKSSQGESQYYQELRDVVYLQTSNSAEVYKGSVKIGIDEAATTYLNQLRNSPWFNQATDEHFGKGSFNNLFQ